MPKMHLETRQVGPWNMNTYALLCPTTNSSVLIDPGDDPDTLFEMIEGSNPIAILLTHSHIDHIGALSEMRQKLAVPVITHPGPHAGDVDLKEDGHLKHGDFFQVGDYRLQVYHTPGHIDDQVLLTAPSAFYAEPPHTLLDLHPYLFQLLEVLLFIVNSDSGCDLFQIPFL